MKRKPEASVKTGYSRRFTFSQTQLRCITHFVAVCIALGLAASPRARADGNGFQLDRYQPTPAGEWFFSVEHPWYSSTRYLAAGLTLDYGHNPLVITSRDRNGSILMGDHDRVIEHQLVGHLDVAGSLFDRLGIFASLPVTLLEQGDATAARLSGVTPASGAVVGDPNVGARVRLYGQPDRDPFSIGAGIQLWIPVGAGGKHAGDTTVRVLPKILLAGLSHWLRWSTTLGVLYRPTESLAVTPAGVGNTGSTSELQLGVALAWTDARHRLSIGPEATLATALGASAFARTSTSLEVLGGAHYLIADTILVGAAIGLGLLEQQGTPDVRVLFRAAWAPVRKTTAPTPPADSDGDLISDPLDACPHVAGQPSLDPARNGCPPLAPSIKDKDKDGVADELDLCPTEPQGKNLDPKRPGCPASDSDADGVFDSADLCPTVAAGPHPDPRRPGCPEADHDGDGLYDSEDMCSEVPAGVHPDLAHPGCPLPDRDGDSVPDAVDACPDQAGAPSSDPAKNGCPGLVQVKNGMIVILSPVFFAVARDLILPRSFPVLQAVAEALKATPEIKLIAIEGHTDDRGKREENMDLSDRRARSVVRFLVEKGIDASRLASQGFGSEHPITSNKIEAGRAQNRRVEFRIIDPAPAVPAPPNEISAPAAPTK